MRDLAKRAILASGALRLVSPDASAAILMYHSVKADPSAHTDLLGGIVHSETEFRAQMQVLSREFRAVSLGKLVDILKTGEEIPERSVVVTFDDGYTDNRDVAMPILNELGIPATFVCGVEEGLQVAVPGDAGSLMMNYDQIRGLVQNGHIVGSHTLTHPNMAHITEDEAKVELAESKRRLEQQLSTAVTHFSYPCPAMTTHWSEQTVAQTRSVGYRSAVTTNGGVTQAGDNPLSLKRIRPTKTAEGLRWNLECAFAGRAM